MHILGEALDVPLPDRLSLCPSFWVLFGFALYRLRHVYIQDTYTLQPLTCTKHTFTLIWIIDKFTYIFIQRLIDKYRLRIILYTNEPWRYLSLYLYLIINYLFICVHLFVCVCVYMHIRVTRNEQICGIKIFIFFTYITKKYIALYRLRLTLYTDEPWVFSYSWSYTSICINI